MVGVPMREQWLELRNRTRRFVLWPCELPQSGVVHRIHRVRYGTFIGGLSLQSPTRGSRLMANLRLWQALPPRLEPKVSSSGSQRVSLLTIMNANGGADAVINGGLNTVWWCADLIREGCAAWPEGSAELSSQF